MKGLQRAMVGLVAIAASIVINVQAGAQVLKHVRDDALVVVKLNNAQAINDKLMAISQKMGLANLHPALANPLAMLQQQLNLKQGLNLQGEAAVVVFAPIAGENEPRAIALIPVSDYKAFLSNFADVKKDGDADSFTVQADGEPLFAEPWGAFAAVTPWKDLLLEAPQGLQVTGVIAKQLQEKDLTVYVNIRPIREKVLPQVQQIRQMLQNLPDGDNAAPGMPGPFQKAMALQVFSGVEAFLTQAQAGAMSLNVTPAGFTSTFSVEFDANSAWGKSIQQIENTNASLLVGLPQESYLAFGGFSLSGARLWSLFQAMYAQPTKAIKLDEADAKALQAAWTGYEQALAPLNGMSFGLVTPPAGTAPTGLIRMVSVMNGDTKALMEGNKIVWQNQNAFMKATGSPGISMKSEIQPNAKTIDGVSLTQLAMEINIDPNAGADPAAAQILTFLYGKGMSMFMGAINDKLAVSGVGVEDAQLQKVIAAAKQGQSPMAADNAVKGMANELPAKRIGVAYISVGNIITTALDVASQMGVAPPLKLPADLPPMGVSVGTEGSTLRVDAHVPSVLIENLVSTGLQIAMQREQARRQMNQP